MRKPLALAMAMFALVAAGVATIALATRTSSSESGEYRVTESATTHDSFDYEGAVLKYYAEVSEFAAALQADQLEKADKAEADRKAAEAAKRAAQAPPKKSPAAPQYPINSNYDPGDGSVWDRIAQCESGGNWSINTGNGYSGGLQFAHASWGAYGGTDFAPMAWQASRSEQIIVAERIRASQGGTYRAWPGCRAKLGLP